MAWQKSRIAIIVGSNRRNSINRKLARALAKLGADKFDASFIRIDDLPMFNQDLEGSLPEEAVRFKSEIVNADGVLIVTPEHDRSIPALLKNAVDWGARPYGKNSWARKPGFITGTSRGAIGSALAQQHLRSVVVGLGMILLGGEAYVTFKPNLVDDDSNITDESTRKFLQGFLDRFVSLVVRISVASSASAFELLTPLRDRPALNHRRAVVLYVTACQVVTSQRESPRHATRSDSSVSDYAYSGEPSSDGRKSRERGLRTSAL